MFSPCWIREKKEALLSPLLNSLGTLPVMSNDVTLHYTALWTFVCGAALVWTVMHLRRNAHFRKIESDGLVFESQLKNILQHSREAIYSFDLVRGRFDYLSPACFSLTGSAAEEIEMAGLSGLLKHVHPEDQDKVARLTQTLRHRTQDREWLGLVEFRFRHRDGNYRSLSDHLHVSYDSSGNAVTLSGSVRDVTQGAHLEESMHILERKFQDSQKMAGLGLLSSGIAHDFNNLMTVVLGNAELALLECGEADSSLLEEIKRTTLRASELANQMLVYTGKTTVAIDCINLSSVVREMGSLLDVSISKKVTIQYSLSDEVPAIRGDISQIRQVAMNLITNASEAIGDRPGVIAIRIHGVDLKSGEVTAVFPAEHVLEGPHVLLEVSDTGSGIDEEKLSKIFDPLFTTKVTGRGLGLASLLNAVQRHNGAVEVSSTEGHGTVFRVYFPVKEEGVDEAEADAVVVDDEWHGYGTVLIADDEESIREITRALLERIGFRVITATDGQEAVDRYTEDPEGISVLLLDINMPRLNGHEAALRIHHINPTVPVLFMSGYPREHVMDRFGKQPHTDFINKPFQSRELAVAIRRVMDVNNVEKTETFFNEK